MISAWRFHAVVAGLLLAGTPYNAHPAETHDIALQRAAFRAIYPEVERGNWQPVLQYERLLRGYVLWLDLRASYLRARLKLADHTVVAAFLDQYGTLKPARELRYQFALHLADAGHLSEYLDIYRRYYRDLDIAKLDCLALQAEIEDRKNDVINNRALDLWLVGKSQEDECDPVFAYLRNTNVMTVELYKKRFAMAVDERHFSLARYLSKSLAAGYLEQTNYWLEAQNNSLEFLRLQQDQVDDEVGRRQLIYAIERIAFDEPLLALEYWLALQKRHKFSLEQQHYVSRHVALWAARRQLPEARALLFDLAPDAVDKEVRRWMIRTSLRREEW